MCFDIEYLFSDGKEELTKRIKAYAEAFKK